MTFAEHHSYPGNSLLDFFSHSPLVPQIHRISRKTLSSFPACSFCQLVSLFRHSSSFYHQHHPAIKSRDLLQQLLPFSLLQLSAKSYVFLPKWQSLEYEEHWCITTVTLWFRASYRLTWVTGISFQTLVPKSDPEPGCTVRSSSQFTAAPSFS